MQYFVGTVKFGITATNRYDVGRYNMCKGGYLFTAYYYVSRVNFG